MVAAAAVSDIVVDVLSKCGRVLDDKLQQATVQVFLDEQE